jgi:hypothetical protein
MNKRTSGQADKFARPISKTAIAGAVKSKAIFFHVILSPIADRIKAGKYRDAVRLLFKNYE